MRVNVLNDDEYGPTDQRIGQQEHVGIEVMETNEKGEHQEL